MCVRNKPSSWDEEAWTKLKFHIIIIIFFNNVLYRCESAAKSNNILLNLQGSWPDAP